MRKIIVVVSGLAWGLVGCGGPAEFAERSCADANTSICKEFFAADTNALLEAVNTLEDDTTIVLGEGTFKLDQQLTLRDAKNVTLWGQGMGVTVLDFGDQAAQSNGVDAVIDRFEAAYFTVLDAKKDGVRVENSTDIWLHHLEATWTDEENPENGAYGLYPVRSRNVLMENCEASNSSDAGIYVGQVVNAIVRNNVARKNVAGIEIENTQFAQVYGNLAEDNTAGLLIFDLPGNPIVGRDIAVYDNVVRNNNTPNFAPGGTVSQLPAGTGTFTMASRRVEIANNTYENNDTMDVGIVSGLVIEPDFTLWTTPRQELVGARTDDLLLLQTPEFVTNFQTTDIWVHNNTFAGDSGDAPDEANQFGLLFTLVYQNNPIDNIIYDGIQEGSFDANSAAGNTNDNHICITGNKDATVANLNLQELADNPIGATVDQLYRPEPPFAPYNCTGFQTGPLQKPTLTFGINQ